MIYERQCGKWELSVSEPHPAWVTITLAEEPDRPTFRLLRIEDLVDLRHLIDRAIAAADARGVA